MRKHVLRRDYNAMIAESGNIYFLGKIGATDGKSFVQLAANMTGMTPESYTAMMPPDRVPDPVLLTVLSCPFYGVTPIRRR